LEARPVALSVRPRRAQLEFDKRDSRHRICWAFEFRSDGRLAAGLNLSDEKHKAVSMSCDILKYDGATCQVWALDCPVVNGTAMGFQLPRGIYTFLFHAHCKPGESNASRLVSRVNFGP
jgi:hypothetical protein